MLTITKLLIIHIVTIILILSRGLLYANKDTNISNDYNVSYNKVDSIINITMTNHNIPGTIVGVWLYKKKPIIIAKGKANIKTGKNIKSHLKVRIGSITKSFVTTIILQLVDEGKVSLNDRLYKFLPEIPNSKEITIRHLCNHTSGIFNYLDDDECWNSFNNELLRKWTPHEILKITIKHKPYCKPGERWGYSNTNAIILGIIIEQLTGNRLEEEINKRICKPLNLSNTYLPIAPFIFGEYCHGYIKKNENDTFEDVSILDPSMAWAAGGMISNLYDLNKWASVLAKGDLLSNNMYNERLKWIETDRGFKHGLGIINYYGAYGFDGLIQGYNTCIFFLPYEKATIISLFNISTIEQVIEYSCI